MADTKEYICCPACNSEMAKIYIPEDGINIDICTKGCGGILFDNRELNNFDDLDENVDEILGSLVGKTFASVDKSKTRVCPLCKTPMVKMGAGKGGVEIDYCNVCGAKFLDNGELQTIRNSENLSIDEFNNLMNIIYQENMKEVLGENVDKLVAKSPRRQFFENLVFNHLIK